MPNTDPGAEIGGRNAMIIFNILLPATMDSKTSGKKRIRNPRLTREKLLQATLDLVAEKGVEALSMKEAALRAEVSRSVAYLHFEDREHLLKEAKAWISEGLQQHVKRSGKDETLYERVLYTTKLIMKNPVASKVMMLDALAGGEFDLCDPLYSAVSERLNKIKAAGGLEHDVDVEIMSYIHLGGSIASALLLRDQHKGDDPDDLAERFAREWTRVLESGMFHKK